MTATNQPRLFLQFIYDVWNERTWRMNEDFAIAMRDKLKELEMIARDYSDFIKSYSEENFNNKWETIEQSILAMRHIEDARMKYWKVIQYWKPDGNWESTYR